MAHVFTRSRALPLRVAVSASGSRAYPWASMVTRMLPSWHAPRFRRLRWLMLPALAVLLYACTGGAAPPWRLTDVRGHLPDLRFRLIDGNGRQESGQTYRGKLVVLYFGYTH